MKKNPKKFTKYLCKNRMKESSKSAWDTDVTIQLAVSGQSKKK